MGGILGDPGQSLEEGLEELWRQPCFFFVF